MASGNPQTTKSDWRIEEYSDEQVEIVHGDMQHIAFFSRRKDAELVVELVNECWMRMHMVNRIARIVIPNGYKDAYEFSHDCGYELADPVDAVQSVEDYAKHLQLCSPRVTPDTFLDIILYREWKLKEAVVRSCAQMASIHSRYPTSTEYEHGYADGRKEAGRAILQREGFVL